MMNPQLLEWTEQQLRQGMSKDAIRSALLAQGWQASDVEEALAAPERNAAGSSVPVAPNSSAAKTVYCPKCGARNPESAKFCDACGAKLEAVAASQDVGTITGEKKWWQQWWGLIILFLTTGLIGVVVIPMVWRSKLSSAIKWGITVVIVVIVWSLNIYLLSLLQKNSPQTQSPAATSTASDLLETGPYVNTQIGFQIRPPMGWSINEGGQSGAHVIFLNPIPDQEGENQFSANLNVVSEPVEDVSLQEYVEFYKEFYPKFFTDYALVEERNVTLANGQEAYILGSTFTQGVLKIRNLQLLAVDGTTGYGVTATAAPSAWDTYKKVFEASLLTFELI